MSDFCKVNSQRKLLQSYPQKIDAQNELFIERILDYEIHQIVGMHLVIKEGHPHKIWDEYHVNSNIKLTPNWKPKIKSLTIFCDTLEIHGEFHIPEINIAIFARKLIWVNNATINTSPLEWNSDYKKAQQFKDGLHGRDAGNIYIGVSNVSTNDKNKKRLIANGGKGQDAGAGRDGEDGISKNPIHQHHFRDEWSGTIADLIPLPITVVTKVDAKFNPPATFYECKWHAPMGGYERTESGGDREWPKNGEDAIAPGRAGDAGNGGDLITNSQELIDSCENEGGIAGKKERNYKGGKAGTPTKCAQYYFKLYRRIENVSGSDTETKYYNENSKVTKVNTTKNGDDARAKSAYKEVGYNGEKKARLYIKNGWLTPFNLQKSLEYIQMLFLANAREEAEKLLVEYQTALNLEIRLFEYWNSYAFEWINAKSEIAIMLLNLRNNLDYFGNMGGYAPLYSISTLSQFYKEETEQALKTLLLSHTIEKNFKDKRKDISVFDETIKTLKDSSNIALKKLNIKKIEIEELEKESKLLENEINNLMEKLKSEPKEDETIKMISTLATVIPTERPVLGNINSLTYDKNVNLNAFESITLAIKKIISFKEDLNKELTIEVIKQWERGSDNIGNLISKVSENLKILKVDKLEVDEKLKQLEIKGSKWKEFVELIRKINYRKINILSKFNELSNEFVANYILILSNELIIQQLNCEKERDGKLSKEMANVISQIKQRSHLFLTKYIYLIVRAYESTLFEAIPNAKVWEQKKLMEKLNEIVKKESFNIDNWSELNFALDNDIENLRKKLLTYLEDMNRNENKDEEIPLRHELSQNLFKNGSINVNFFELMPESFLQVRNLIRIKNIKLREIKPEPLPPLDIKDFVISIKLSQNGTMRKNEELYSVNSKNNLEWQWECSIGKENKIESILSPKVDKNMRSFILGKNIDKDIAETYWIPLCGNYEISLLNTSHSKENIPLIENLNLTFTANMNFKYCLY